MRNKHLLVLILLISICPEFTSAQTPVKMADQSNYTFTEDFHDVRNWGDNFSSGEGAEHWLGVPIISGDNPIPAPDTTTSSTEVFGFGFSEGVQPSPGDTSGTYIQLLANGTDDNTDAVAIDFFVDFSNTTAAMLNYKAFTSFTGRSSYNRAATLRLYYSIDGGNKFTELTDARYTGINHTTYTPTQITVPLPAELDGQQVLFRFYCYNGGVGGSNGSRPRISFDNLSVTATAPLPVTLVNFNAARKNNDVQLSWQTDSEFNSSTFVIQRSFDGRHFTEIGSQKAAGYSNQVRYYNYTDKPSRQGPFFYRLESVDNDGKFSFSKIVEIDYQPIAHINVYPIPAANKLHLQLAEAAKKNIKVSVIDAAGKVVKEVMIPKGNSSFDINIERLTSGQYYLQLSLQGNAIPFIKK